jgi:uncharacterized protein YjbJ (UPF0337 family)
MGEQIQGAVTRTAGAVSDDETLEAKGLMKEKVGRARRALNR